MPPEREPEPLTSRTLTQRQAFISTTLAAALAALVILTLLGHNRLTDWDEGIYAQVSREMLQSGWLIPHWNTLVWIDKPPLTYWITALFFRLFGVSEFTARLGSALSAITLVTVLHAWLLRATNRLTTNRETAPLTDDPQVPRPFRAGSHSSSRKGGFSPWGPPLPRTARPQLLTAWLSTFILLSTFGFLHVARVGETDTLLSLGSFLALIGLANLLQPSEQPSTAPTHGWYLFWTGFAIALMSKGAASGTLLFTLLALLLLDANLRRRARAHFFYGFLLFLALTLPWHLYMLHRFGQVFVKQYLGLHVLGRVAYQFDGHLTPWWYYARVLLFSAPPWVLAYPVALYAAFRNPTLRPLRPFAVFAIVQILFFSCVQTRLPHYMAPAYAPLSALVAIWLAAHLHTYLQSHPAARPRTARLQLAAALTILWIITALLTAHLRSRLHSPRLPNGEVTPNNHEEVALLKQVFRHPTPLVANTPGPLLDWRAGTYNPIPTDNFYSNRPVPQG
ncbi:MAG: glycosyltransferase family 39 protein, partial [Acidobacteriaceae bacterium]